MPVQGQAHDDRAWVVVDVPASSDPADAAASARAEKRWPMAFTLLLAIAVPLVLPPRFSLGPPWAVPATEAVLLVAIVAIDRGRIDRRSTAGRALAATTSTSALPTPRRSARPM
jgi:hypothetical protein